MFSILNAKTAGGDSKTARINNQRTGMA